MITREKSEGNSLVLKMKVSANVWAKALEEAYERNKGKFNIQGFRKGKAPRKFIEKEYGDTVFYDDAFDSVVSKEYADFLKKNKDVEPVDYPNVVIDSITDKGVEATLNVTLMPEVKLGEYTGLKFKKDKVEVTEEMVEHEISHLIEKQARFVESEEKSEMGDFVTLDFKGTVDGVAFDGGSAEDFRLELGSHSFIDNFEDQLCGLKKDESKDVVVTFPKDYPAKELAGKESVFACTIKKVEKKELPTLSDKLVADSTDFETVEEYKKDLREKLLEAEEQKAQRNFENQVIEAVVKASTVDIPAILIDNEVEHILKDLSQRLAYQRIGLEDYMSYMGTTVEEFKKQKREEATHNVKARLVLQKIIKDNKLSATQKEMDEKIMKYSKTTKDKLEDFKKSLSEYEKAYIENDVIMTKLVKLLSEGNIVE